MTVRSSQTKAVILFILIVYPVVGISIYASQRHIIFRSGGPYLDPPRHLDIEKLFIRTEDGETLYAWWLHSEKADKTVLFFQGNGRNLTYQKTRLTTFSQIGVNAFLIDYRGYGKSSGEIENEEDIYVDGTAALDFLTNTHNIPLQDIIVWGRSLGGGVAAEIAQERDVSALVLESTFFSLDDMARMKYWYLPTGLFLKFHFANGDKLKHVKAPVIIIHSIEDGYIPISQAVRLYDAAKEPKKMIRTTGSHLDLFDRNQNHVLQLSAYLELCGQNIE